MVLLGVVQALLFPYEYACFDICSGNSIFLRSYVLMLLVVLFLS